ncbi:glycosyltransferase [Shewanella sp. Choline-02u-19]|jgi:glycosyltransferase involved in cell wall biosynthesis|uniref:glycosyltransferase n=1 Tax=unclassified Shewanella TaxID=196818 RepID=UPI000C321479|nr:MULTISPECIES: glycosyltransferase [unclassified Shewanella]PKG57650.1 glycosyltransferase [Shewanella sp. GutDb-MelDb]PKG72927.1 glycosyltransferase [Shewanella sp. GutCb]PKH58249.1 glycosyltransferase [Shewanella sp. Bg11-22]PKI29488.1 glycosyltransferase [Shewanella sp. Choline-02u-19]
MKKVAIFCHNLFANGTVKVALTQAEVLQEAGQDVHLFIFNEEGDFTPPKNVTIHYVFKSQKSLSLAAQKNRLIQCVQNIENSEGEFSLFLCNSTDCDIVVNGCDFDPCYYFCHCALQQELIMELKRGPIHFLRRWRKAKALIGKRIITVSEGIADELKATRWLKPKSVQAIYNPFRIDEIREKAKKEVDGLPNEPFMIHIGRVTRQKRLDILFQTLKLMPTAPRLVLLTNRPEKARKLAKKYDVENRIITPGFQSNPYAWIARAELMLLSSDFEGLPTVLIESLICQTPVVSTRCPHGPSEILTGELAQYLVPRRQPELLAASALACLQKPPLLENLPILDAVASQYIAKQYIALCANN